MGEVIVESISLSRGNEFVEVAAMSFADQSIH